MKKQIIFLFLIFPFMSCVNREENAFQQQDEKIELPPPPKKIDQQNLIGFACYYSGKKSEPVKRFSNLLTEENFTQIREKLNSKFIAEKYLSTIVCLRLDEKKIISLSQVELNQIEKNKISNEKLTICSGCTNEDELSLKELLTSKTYISNEVERWLEKMIL